MPVSIQFQITPCVSRIIGAQPKSVLDVGCGFGKWGYLCREYLDAFHGRFRREDGTAFVIGYTYAKKGAGNRLGGNTLPTTSDSRTPLHQYDVNRPRVPCCFPLLPRDHAGSPSRSHRLDVMHPSGYRGVGATEPLVPTPCARYPLVPTLCVGTD